MSLEWWKAFFEIGGVILLLLTFAFGAGALIVNNRLNAIQASELRQFDRDLTNAKMQLRKQQERTAEAIEKAESERLSRIKLEKELEPRRLTGEQKIELAKLLGAIKAGVAIVSPMADGEASDFADDLDSAIKAASWETVRIKNLITEKFGLSVVTTEGTKLPSEKLLSDALTEVGIAHNVTTVKNGDASTHPAFQAGYLYLVVEHKPLPEL